MSCLGAEVQDSVGPLDGYGLQAVHSPRSRYSEEICLICSWLHNLEYWDLLNILGDSVQAGAAFTVRVQ